MTKDGSNNMKVIVVGNGPSIKNRKLGEKIDLFDLVVRLNNFVTQGIEEDTGTKVDMWATSMYHDVDRSKGENAAQFLLALNHFPASEEWLIREQELKKLASGRRVEVVGTEDIQSVREALKGIQPSTGILTLAHLISTYGSVTAVGFDFFSSAIGHHYFDKTLRSSHCPHNGDLERQWFYEMVRKGFIKVLEEDGIKSSLISKYSELHKKNPSYGKFNRVHSKVFEWAKGRKLKRVLDYGCGKGHLVGILKNHGVDAVGYDPAVAEFSVFPVGEFDGICCTDVLEHLPLSVIPEVLAELKKATDTVFLNVSTRDAVFHFDDGRNCHETVCTPTWWRKVITEHLADFYIVHDHELNDEYLAVLKRNR